MQARIRSRILGPVAGVVVLAAGVGASVVVHEHATRKIQEDPGWHGKVGRVVHSGPEGAGTGLTVGASSGATEGALLPAGARVATDAWTRARIDLEDGTGLSMDRSTAVVLSGTRSLELVGGQLALDVEATEGARDIQVHTSHGDITTRSGRLVLTATPDRTTLQMTRGTASVVVAGRQVEVGAGEEGVFDRSSALVTPASDLASRRVWSERLEPVIEDDGPREAGWSGLGELVARRPGKTDEKERALHLATHSATIRIAANVARTEVEEVFSNDTNDDLEGVYRFPLPDGAQMEKLALDVDGKLVPGSFVEKAKAAAIWRGAIHNAAPKEPKPQQEIVWVPGPWHDPALLEWNGGGKFELKIFPIPKHGSRRIQLAYTETVPQAAGARRYVYPLPEFGAGAPALDHFSLDVQVRGADPTRGVHAGGYDLRSVAPNVAGGVVELAMDAEHFTPAGDLTLEYALERDREADLTAWAYRDPTSSGDETDPFVVLAIRPQLPRWSHETWRDQVIVVDDGHSMTGDRFKEAGRLAARIAEEMDRRDRVTLLACDVACRRLPAGWLSPGAAAAGAIRSFLEDVTPEGATDLVSALRTAGSVPDRLPANDLRVVLLSSGVASAGYRRSESLSSEVLAALPDARAEVVTVPIGGDADQATLREIARGGGGVVVPYLASRPTEETALAILSATYGATLRDVEVSLPDGLYASAPSVVAPIRAGDEEFVVARMRGDRVQGEATLKGKVGGQPFEAHYPLDVRASNEPGNAFVPRLYASERIASLERTTGDKARPELVRLSQRFAVPSRYTSLLVLESEAMFQAFGIDRTKTSSAFTGENDAVASFASKPSTPGKRAASFDDLGAGADPEESDAFGTEKSEAVGFGTGAESRRGGAGGGAPVPRELAGRLHAAPALPPRDLSAASGPPVNFVSQGDAAPASSAVASTPLGAAAMARPTRGGRWMKREWFRSAAITRPTPPISPEKIATARAALAAAPDERGKHKELARLLSIDGSLGELEDELTRWTTRDPLDEGAIALHADVLARRGKRDEALRVLSGALATTRTPLDLERTLASVYARAGKIEACSFWIAAAELAPADVDSVAHAAGCERASGRASSADRWLASLTTDGSRAKALPLALKYEGYARTRESAPERASWGDIVVDASWDEGVDLDIVVVDPLGNRQSWSSRSGSVRAEDTRSTHHESLALSTSAAGPFLVEIVRSDGDEHAAPVHGTIRLRSLGANETRSFELDGPVAEVARVDVRWESRLVPIENVPAF